MERTMTGQATAAETEFEPFVRFLRAHAAVIGELSSELGVAQHILRYWESKFPQLRPLQRAGNRRYYRPADVELARTIHRLLNGEGYTVRGVQKLLRSKDPAPSRG